MFSLCELFMHPKNAPFAVFDEDFSDKNKKRLESILSEIFPEEYHNPPPYFNTWFFMTDNEGWIIGRRLTWSFCIGGNWEKLIKDLKKEKKASPRLAPVETGHEYLIEMK